MHMNTSVSESSLRTNHHSSDNSKELLYRYIYKSSGEEKVILLFNKVMHNVSQYETAIESTN